MKIRNWTRKYCEEAPGDGSGEGAAPTGEPTSWLSGLPEELQGNATLQDIKDVSSLAKQYVDTKAMVGNSIRIPSEDAPAEDMLAFRQSLVEKNIGLMAVPDTDDAEVMAGIYKAMGLPEDASGYTKPENWVGMSDERFGFLAAEAHKRGLSKGQFEAFAATLAAEANTTQTRMSDEFNGEINTLKGEWGNAYVQKVARATNVAKQLEAPEALQQALVDGKVDAGTLRWLDKIASKFGGEGTALVTETGEVSEFTPSELKERVDELTKKMLDMNSNDPAYQGLLEKRIKFQTMLTPGNL